jgi:hypothetical protein
MKSVIFACLVVSLCLGSAIAQDLGNSRELPVKNTPVVTYEPPVVPKQGGDTIYDAYPIPGLPYSNTGTTAGYDNDYDEVCPWGSTSPDVVYSFSPSNDVKIDVDLCGSSYDTKTYIISEGWELIACNDDYYYDDPDCGHYTSLIQDAFLTGGVTYFIMVDGYGGDNGPYVFNVAEYEQCFVYCPEDAVAEGEPPMQHGYEDAFNGGCNSPEFGNPFQAIDWTNDADGVTPYDGTAWLCGKSGWYFSSPDGNVRDTDWFIVYALETGMMEFTVESEYPCYMFKLAPLDCATVAVELEALVRCGTPATLSFPVVAGEEIWLWVGPTALSGPVTEFPYFMTVSNNTFDVVPNEEMSWGGVKSLYR